MFVQRIVVRLVFVWVIVLIAWSLSGRVERYNNNDTIRIAAPSDSGSDSSRYDRYAYSRSRDDYDYRYDWDKNDYDSASDISSDRLDRDIDRTMGESTLDRYDSGASAYGY